MIARPLLGLAALLATSLSALAQDATTKVDPADLETIRGCLEDGGDAQSCSGLVANPCQEAPGGSSTIGIGECFQRETAAWDTLLNEQYKAALATAKETDERLGEQSAESVEHSLIAAQRAWIAYRDAECSRLYALNQEGTIRSVVFAACERDMTARRTVELRPEQL